MVEVLRRITQKREQKIQNLGFSFGHIIPVKRLAPLCPPKFDSNLPLMIAEIKRASPSAGHIGDITDPISLAADYLNSGARVISVLTEEDYFNGSLQDLIEIKNTFKNASILRKDFIQYPQEIEISYLCGADLVLVIIAMFIEDIQKEVQLKEIFLECKKYGLTPLVEIHNQEELNFALKFQPFLLGINSRNLHTFEINKPKAMNLKSNIPPSIKTIFESGIQSSFDGYLAGNFSFDGLLCGSYLVKSEEKNIKIPSLIKSFNLGKKYKNPFYPKVFDSSVNHLTPLIKICGITNIDDAFLAAELGVDMIGFILEKTSPRYQDIKSIKNISKALSKIYPQILKIGVITENKETLLNARELFKEGVLDALQLHSANPLSPNQFASYDLKEADFNFYICVNFENLQDYPNDCISPFVLLDSKSNLKGGSGQTIPLEVLKNLKDMGKDLFIAGGIGMENIEDILSLKPKMLDINSQIENSPGKKDKFKLKAIIEKIKNSSQGNQ
ncbi:bifunctional indole-3-glycerol phosphate synthase/phosphoribosylanthranilate isomerase [Helicobacter sp. 13S00477-4]|uniref:phosphoribosylanthranilate isomerase n=1 Tax=Helicobacter sp. 13S00477-4 TaxID=1905759 RepID=UPI000BA6BC53|nr:bifunctional indole-3-glycerol phosphate synthase/phosphoribosylanthranilate isomerase [Helicobacter sp. 13S00477-4]PAF52622.1 hypothetical protein BKH44_00070 [Helicobacter sp. 13S00477-4]